MATVKYVGFNKKMLVQELHSLIGHDFFRQEAKQFGRHSVSGPVLLFNGITQAYFEKTSMHTARRSIVIKQ